MYIYIYICIYIYIYIYVHTHTHTHAVAALAVGACAAAPPRTGGQQLPAAFQMIGRTPRARHLVAKASLGG